MTYLDYAARGKNAGWRYAAGLSLALVLAMVFAFVITLPLALLHALPADLAQQMQHAVHPTTFYAAQGVVFAVVLAGFAAAIAIVHNKRPADIIGLWRWRAFAAGLGIWLAVLIITSLIDFALSPSGFTFTANAQTPILAVCSCLALAVQTFAEEFVFRGYITQGLLLATRRPMVTAVLSGLVFGSIHIPNGIPQAANAVVFGVVLALIAIRTGGLAFGLGVHMVNNIYGAVVMVSSDDVFRGSPGLFTQHTPRLMWWDTATAAVALLLVGGLVLRGAIGVYARKSGPVAVKLSQSRAR
jgi:membrane protease YdiL (CAAX protease family)